MPLSLYSYNALLAVVDRLNDATYGYNANITAYNALASADVALVNFASGAQFFQAYADIGEYEDGTTFTYPLMQVYVIGGQNTNTEKFREFAGPVQIGIEVWHTFPSEEVDVVQSELTAAVVEASVIHAFNQSGAGAFTPGCGVLWNGSIKHAKQRLQPFGDGFRLGQVFVLTFEVRV